MGFEICLTYQMMRPLVRVLLKVNAPRATAMMPPVEGITDADIKVVISCVGVVQKANGIF